MLFHIYILQSETSGQLYKGQTNDLDDRLVRHNSNRNKATKGRGPWKLIFSKSYTTRAEAVQIETMMKKWKNRDRIFDWIAKQSG